MGYINRKLNLVTSFNQGAIPLTSPNSAHTKELVWLQSFSYRSIEAPINLAYKFAETNAGSYNVNAGLVGHYLLSSYYEAGRYTGKYKQNYFQGISFTCGVGADYHISKTITMTSRLNCCLINMLKNDAFVNRAPAYKFVSLSLGVLLPSF
ncbi:MAG: hypothetical protein SGJ10_03910 [Bacteroidota bacterium]|nr:hypothetical protein [Bacteroidota bacterium]